MLKQIIVGAVVAALAVIAAGCGGGDSSTSSSPPLSHQQFAQKASTICEKGEEKRFAALRKEAEQMKVNGEGDLNKLIEEVAVPEIEGMVAELRELTPPENISGEVEEWLDKMQAGAETAKSDTESFQSGEAFAGANQFARANGVPACSI